MKWRNRLNIPTTVLDGVSPSSLSDGFSGMGGGILKSVVLAALALCLIPARAETFVLTKTPNSLTDWQNAEFYAGESAPTGAATDEIQISPGVEVTVSNTQSDVVAFLNGISNLSLVGNAIREKPQSKLTIYVEDGETWNYASRIEEASHGSSYSMVEKRGKGALRLGHANANAYWSFWHVVEGELWLPGPDTTQNNAAYKYFAQTWIERDGAVRLDALSKFVAPNGSTYDSYWAPSGVYNAGVVSNSVSGHLACVYIQKTSLEEPECACDGVFSKFVALLPQAGSVLSLQGAANEFTDYVYINGDSAGGVAMVYARKLGKKANGSAVDASSVGVNNSLLIKGIGGGRIVYTGTGETCDKDLYFMSGSAQGAPAVSEINGGEHGGLKLTGALTRWSSSTCWIPHIVFGGDNAEPCVFQGTEADFVFNDSSASASPYFGNLYPRYHLKTGTGEWYFPSNPNNTAAGTWQVANGTLAYDKIGPRGECHSLGSSTNCYVWEAMQPDESKRAEYAFLLGSADLTEVGIMECRSETGDICTDRPFGVIGRGGFRSNHGRVLYGNVFGVGPGEKMLVLEGTSAVASEVCDVSDGTDGGTLSVVKRGSGTWTLGGNQTFTGGIAVEGGTLVVGRPKKYMYYRLLIQETMDNNPELLAVRKEKNDGISLESQNSATLFDEIGLWAADNSRQNMNLTFNPEGGGANLKPGEFGFGNGLLYQNKKEKGNLPLLFDGCRYTAAGTWAADQVWGTSILGGAFYRDGKAIRSPRLNDESTWIAVDMCLREGAQSIDHFDVSSPANDLDHSTAARGAPTACQLLGSVDGRFWESISDTQSVTHSKDLRYKWVSNGDSTSGGGLIGGGSPFYPNPESDERFNRANGWKTVRTTPAAEFSVLENLNGVVSVSNGATLRFMGDAADAPIIRKLAIDATSGGTIDGFALADDCELDMANVPDAKDFELPVTFVNLPSSLSLKGWTVKFNGTVKRRALSFANGKLTVHAYGMAVIIR